MEKNIVIKLGSGNFFHYLASDDYSITQAFVTDSHRKEFLGGFLGTEAKRKFKAFSSFPDCEVLRSTDHREFITKILYQLSFTEFSKKLGELKGLFLKFRFETFTDLDDANGRNSLAQSCNERAYYYKAVGLSRVYGSTIEVPIWGFVANHLSVFGTEKFEDTFSGNKSLPNWEKDMKIRPKTRYSDEGFKLPAAYFKFLCYSRRHKV